MPLDTLDLDQARIGVLCGGHSPERPGSLASGEAAAKALAELGLNVELIDLAEVSVSSLVGQIDIALLATHGLGGEDGKVQGALDTLGIPYTGSGVLASAIGMYKPTFKTLLSAHRIDTPAWVVLDESLSTSHAVSTARMSLQTWPLFFKPCSGGGSLVAGVARDESELSALVDAAREGSYGQYMVEEYMPGMPCTVGVIERDGQPVALPVLGVETSRSFYDYEAKHDASLRTEHCPAPLPEWQAKKMQQVALNVHRLVGAQGVSRVDFMVSGDRTAVLEINTLPGLSSRGNLAAMSKAAGISYPEMVRSILQSALTKPAYVA
ncbi:D-alanine--D-alanine ligase [Streptomyces sp. BF23-18]|uniref:D-alanine--D-alanine ligase family protein n=1 Tax=Streptomyces sp. BF23-18 TaxID=3240282 RepID=UPI0034E4B896